MGDMDAELTDFLDGRSIHARSEEKIQAMFQEEVQNLEKELERANFRLNRTLKDKAIMVNLLNKTIGDLQENQEQLEQANHALTQKNREIELKNLELIRQKELVEEQSQELSKNLRKLELSYRELEQFSYIVAHDLKSPLRAISSYTQLIRKRYLGKLDENADAFIQFIVQGVFHMDNVLSDLLEYSRTGKEVEYQKMDLNKLFLVAKSNIQAEIEDSNALIEHCVLPTLEVQDSGIIQLFQNLMANAIKFNESPKPHIGICAKLNEDGFWHFQVHDNGIGLKTEYEDKVFQPFQRIEPNRFAGTGMGLAICKKIVDMHHGKIWYTTSEKLGGTAFHILLPS